MRWCPRACGRRLPGTSMPMVLSDRGSRCQEHSSVIRRSGRRSAGRPRTSWRTRPGPLAPSRPYTRMRRTSSRWPTRSGAARNTAGSRRVSGRSANDASRIRNQSAAVLSACSSPWRERAPLFWIARATCCSTVRGGRWSVAAISRLVMPAASSATSASRGESRSPYRGRPGARGPFAVGGGAVPSGCGRRPTWLRACRRPRRTRRARQQLGRCRRRGRACSGSVRASRCRPAPVARWP